MLLEELEGLHDGETLWVLGSGPSLNHVRPDFFEKKIVVSTNYSAHTIGLHPDYVFTHYHQIAFDLHTTTGIVVTNAQAPREANWGKQDPWPFQYLDNLVLIERDNYNPPSSNWNPNTTHPPAPLAYGTSSLHGAMHLAGYLGAAHIMMVGADCGTLDGEHRVAGYPEGHKLWALYNQHHKLMKDWLVREYGVTVYSLNPFVNFNLEGHRFEGVDA